MNINIDVVAKRSFIDVLFFIVMDDIYIYIEAFIKKGFAQQKN
jgi:hypothetical protein